MPTFEPIADSSREPPRQPPSTSRAHLYCRAFRELYLTRIVVAGIYAANFALVQFVATASFPRLDTVGRVFMHWLIPACVAVLTSISLIALIGAGIREFVIHLSKLEREENNRE